MALNLTRQQKDRIQTVFLFRGTNQVIIDRIITDPGTVLAHYHKNAVVYDQAHARACLGILLSGCVVVEQPIPDGKRIKLGVLRPNECFGAAAMFGEKAPYGAVLTAERPTDILFIPERMILWAMRRDPAIAENYIHFLSDQIRFYQQKLSGLTALSAKQRIAMFLVSHADSNGTWTGSMTDLSRQLNLGRASLYRAMDSLEQAELIRRDGRVVEILDMQALKQLTS